MGSSLSGTLARIAVAWVFLATAVFASATSTTIHGHVTSHATGNPVSGADISASIGGADAGTTSAPDGSFSLVIDAETAPGATGFVNVYAADYITASSEFDPLDGDISIDFSLQRYGTISGMVSDAVSGAPLDEALVTLLRFDGTSWAPINADYTLAGTYTLYGVEPGTYRICAGGIGNAFARECFDGVDIHSASDIAASTPLVVGDGAVVDSIDFQLAEGARIRGSIRDASTNEPYRSTFSLTIYDAAGNAFDEANANADESGIYELQGVPQGTFYLSARGLGPLYSVQLYAGIACPAGLCPPITSGQPLVVPFQGTVENVDFTLDHAARIAGVVTDLTNGAPVEGARVVACTVPYFIFPACTSGMSAADGHYEFGIEAGHQTVIAYGTDAYADQIYPDVPCYTGFCIHNDSPAIEVHEGDVLTGRDFALHRAAYIAGTVTDDTPSSYSMFVFDSNYTSIVSFQWEPADGHYISPKLRGGGTYYVAAFDDWPVHCVFYADRACPENLDPASIASANPTPIVTGASGTIDGVDLHVPPSDSIYFDGFDPATPQDAPVGAQAGNTLQMKPLR